MATTPVSNTPSTKVITPAIVIQLLAAVSVVLSLFGINVEFEISPEAVGILIGGVASAVGIVQFVIGYFSHENNPSTTAIAEAARIIKADTPK